MLPTLHKNSKWTKNNELFTKGTLVLIIHETIARGNWRKGVVVEVYPNKVDGVIRIVKLRLANGSYLIRAINQLVPVMCQTDNIHTFPL